MLPLLAEAWDLFTYALLYTAWLWGPASVLGLLYTWARVRQGADVDLRQLFMAASSVVIGFGIVCFGLSGDTPAFVGVGATLAVLAVYLVWCRDSELAHQRLRGRSA